MYKKFGVKRGLRDENGTGVLVGLTTIGNVHGYVMNEGEKQPIEGELYYRGINVRDIVAADRREHRFGYEETAFLILFGSLPTVKQLSLWRSWLGSYRQLSDAFRDDAIMSNPSKDLMNAMARAVLFAYAFDRMGAPDDITIENCLVQSVDLISSMPAIAAYSYQAKRHYHDGRSMFIRNPDPEKSTAENFLRLIRTDGKYTKLEAETLDLALILHAEHGGGNNSSFVTHVITSAYSDMYSTIAAATLSLKGSRHGGANLRTMRQMAEMKQNISKWTDKGEVADYIGKIVNRQAGDGTGLVYGLGHAVYTLSDPRAVLLKEKARKLAEAQGRMEEFALYDTIETLGPDIIRKAHPGAREVCANVDLYSGFVYDMLGIPQDLYTPLFAVARVVGWCAHRMEELDNVGPIIRPAYKPVYRARDVREYQPLSERE